MADDRINGYAKGIFEMASGEGSLDRVEGELLTISRAFETSPELRSTLTDPQLPLDKKQGVVDELIGGRATSLTIGVIQLLVSQGRASDIPAIASAVAEVAAASRDKEVAEIRSAVPLDDATVARLTAALGRATGKAVEAKVVVDPSVIGGVVARVGDTVIDGSISKRVDSVRQAVRSN
ncbi:MAG TPA: ATP synthase F1 subunit delta [Acidimicrobiia bacterium]|nr:ATP synthase F1 subunit delta [Acidimicrobiia bacterium]